MAANRPVGRERGWETIAGALPLRRGGGELCYCISWGARGTLPRRSNREYCGEMVVTDKKDTKTDSTAMVMNSALYREFLAEREEILRHKWLESEKAGYDIGFERALLDWIVKHRSAWRKQRKQQKT